MTRTRILGGSLMFAALITFQSVGASAQCRNRIPELGGRTAIHKGPPVEILADLQDLFKAVEKVTDTSDKEKIRLNRKREKYQRAFTEIIKAAKLGIELEDLKTAVDNLQPEDNEEYPEGTELRWMAYRPGKNERIALLWQACWVNDKAFNAWTFTLPKLGDSRTFIIPTDCLNLAELKTRPGPICEISAVPDCVEKKVRVKVIGIPGPGGAIQRYELSKDGVNAPTQGEPKNQWTFDEADASKVTTVRFVGSVTDQRGNKSKDCSASVNVCPISQTGPDCTAPSCNLDVATEWPGTLEKGRITVTWSGPGGYPQELKVIGLAGAPDVAVLSPGVFEAQEGRYKIEFTVNPIKADGAGKCLPSTCSTTVELKREAPKEPCSAPSCHLSATTTGSDIWIESLGPDRTPREPTLRKESDGSRIPLESEDGKWVARDQDEGGYVIDLEVKPSPHEVSKGCQPSTCSTTVKVKPCPTCDSAWFLRAFAAYGEGLGSEETGSLRTPNQQVGAFKLDFNQGLGGGVEVEKRLAWSARDWKTGNWGWNLGFTHLSLKTQWTFDTESRWHRDADFVPTLILTTGPRYHWKRGDLDLHLGPVAGFAQFEDATFADGSVNPGTFEAGFEDSFVVGANFGFDAFLGECWGLSGGVQYLKLPTETVGIDLDVDPLILKFGVVYNIW